MDPVVGTVISVIGPYLAKGAEQFANSAGKAAFESAQALYKRLSEWWSHEPVAEAAAKSFPSNPERYGKVLADQLDYEVSNNQEFANELRALVGGMGPAVEVLQKMDIGRGITGADIQTLVSGTVTVRQDIRDAQNVTGFKAGRVGGGQQ